MKDFVIIGYGAAGFAALIEANKLGIKPTVIGYGPLGGTCVNVGCIPSKRALRIGELYWDMSKLREKYGISPDFDSAFEDVRRLVEELRKRKYEDVLNSYDVELIQGKAHFISPNAVKVNGQVIEGKKFLIATGSSPFIPEIKGLKEAGFWTNVEALYPPKRVDSVAIIGGRAQALEFSQMYKRLGVDVVVLERSKVIIPDWEPEVSLEAQKFLEDEGIYVVTDVKVKEIKKNEGGNKTVVTDRGEVEVDEVLLAAGRRPNVDLNLESANVYLNERGGVRVDEELRTTNPNIYAAGDVIGDLMLEPLAGYEGTVATKNALSNSHKKIDKRSVPQVVFTQPNIARVGWVEKGVETESRVVKLDELPKSAILGDPYGLIKMVVERGSKRVLSVQMVGEDAGEVIHEAVLAVKYGLTVDDLIDTVHAFPTMSEAMRLVSLAFYTDVTKLSCCV